MVLSFFNLIQTINKHIRSAQACNKLYVLPIWIVSPASNSDIANCFPFSRVTVAVDGKQLPQHSATGVPKQHLSQLSHTQHT